MKARCYSKKHKFYSYYGGRGIAVCDRWKDDFWAFVRDMHPKPKGYTLERLDNDRDYEPGNVVWATRKRQMLNMRRNRLITSFGQTLTLAEWSEKTGTVGMQSMAALVVVGLRRPHSQAKG